MWNLNNPTTGKTWSARIDGDTLVTSAGGKERSKTFPSSGEAEVKMLADVWAKLKAGFISVDKEASPGEPEMVRHAGKGASWLGTTAICTPEVGTTFYTQVTTRSDSTVYRLDGGGEFVSVANLPSNRLVRSLVHAGDKLLADIDGQIYQVDPATGETAELTSVPFNLGGSLHVVGDHAVWHDGEHGVVTNLRDGKEVWKERLEGNLWEGHTTMLALALSSQAVATCVSEKTIEVMSRLEGSRQTVTKPEPELTESMWLTESGKLYTWGHYTTLVRYDLATGLRDWVLEGSGHVASVVMDQERQRFAVLYRDQRLSVYDAETTEDLTEFRVLFMVKSGGCAFTETGLAVATDYGSIAHYRLP